MVSGHEKTLLVHRKGSTRAFPPHHPLIPVDYQVIISKMIGAYSLSLSLSHTRTHTHTFSLSLSQLTGQPVLIGGTMGTCR